MTGLKPLPLEILVLDDEAEFRDTVVRRLLRRGYSVCGESTQLALGGRKFDLIITKQCAASNAVLDTLCGAGHSPTQPQVIVICNRDLVENAVEGLPRCATDLMVRPLIWPELDWRVQKAAERTVLLRRPSNPAEYTATRNAADLSGGQSPLAGERPTASLLSADGLAAVQRAHIVEILRREGGNKARTARALGVNRRSLYRLIEKFQIQLSESPVGGAVSTGDR